MYYSKKMKNLVFVLLLLLTACNGSSDKVVFKENVQATSDALSEAFISMPIEIKKEGDSLYVSVFKGDSLLHCYNIKGQRWEKQMLPQGQGANEFLSPIEFFFSNASLFIHNRWHFTAKNYKFDKQNLSISEQSELLRLPMNVDKMYPIGNSRFVASGVFEDCRFLILDKEGKQLAKCGSFPDFLDGEDAIPNSAKAMFHQSAFGYHPSLKRLACATSNVLEFWDESSDTLKLHKRLLLAPYHYVFESTPDGVWANNDNPEAAIGTRGIAVSGEYVYVLYNPNTHKMHDENAETENSEIWMFDWEGNPVRKILTDTHIECFCIDEEKDVFYCIMSAPDLCVGTISF